MSSIDWKRARLLLARLIELPQEQHAAFLAEACGDDPEFADQLRRLHAHDITDAAFLRSPFEFNEPEAGEPVAGESIGPYRLVRELGRGGMGVVWLAEREDEFQQRVALKIIKRGMDTNEVVRRFRRERQLLADLDHPGIVRLLDGGATDDGRPYLALEVVTGLPIDEYCRREQLALEERLQLFARVCEAVCSAHEMGVVHRDLKPANILVTDAGDPKVLDFGIAKVLSGEGAEQSLLTRTGERLLTPRYAAPEQVRGETCTPATDVYALGVVLYELLCDRMPYDVGTGSQRQIESAVCEAIPRRPSRITRGTTHRRLTGDLDVIAMSALAKDPRRRYLDAGGLARDLRRHLAFEPIRARPDSSVYRVGRFVRRNRLLVGTTFAVIVALAVGLVIALIEYARSEQQREAAEWAVYVSAVRSAESQIALHGSVGVGGEHRPEFYGWEWQHLMARGALSLRVVCEIPGAKGLAFDASSRTLATLQKGAALLIDGDNGEISRRITFESAATDLAFSPDGRLLATSHRSAIRVHDVRSGEKLAEWPASGLVKHVRFHPDGRRLAAAHANEAVTLHSLDEPGIVRELAVVKGIIRDLRFSPSGDRIAIAAVEHVVVCGIDDPGLDAMLQLTNREVSVSKVAFSHTGRYIAAISMEGTGRVWDMTTGQAFGPPRHYGSTSNALVFLPDRDELVVAFNTLRIWDLDSGRERSLADSCRFITHIVSHPEKPLLYTAALDGKIVEWNALREQVPRHHLSDELSTEEYGMISVHPDGQSYAAVIENGHSLTRVELETGTLLSRRPSPEAIRDIAYAPRASCLVAARAGGLDILEGHTLEVLATLPIQEAACLAFTPDGNRLLVGTRTGRLVSVDTPCWRILKELDTEFAQITALACAPRGDRLVVAGDQGPGVAVLHLGSDHWSSLENASIAGVRSLACSSDENYFAAGGTNALRVWSAQTGALVHESSWTKVYVAFPDGSERLIASKFGFINVLDTRHWDQTLSLHENRLSLSDMTFAPDGRTLLSADWSGDVLVWNALAWP